MSDNGRVMEWEHGLPNTDDLMPLSQELIPIELMSAFSISPESCRTAHEVNRASQDTLSCLRGNSNSLSVNSFKSLNEEKNRDSFVVEDDTIGDGNETEARKIRRVDSPEEADSALRMEDSMDDQHSNRTSKRHRLVWTPLLHQRFVEVVARLGIKIAVPKTIMQCMNVEGLTRENVASHLQKYRLYLKRNEGVTNEDPSSSDALIESTSVPQSLHESAGRNSHGHVPMQIQMQYPPAMMHMPGYGAGHGHMRMPFGNPNAGHYQGFESHPYNMLQQRDWSSHPHVAPNEK